MGPGKKTPALDTTMAIGSRGASATSKTDAEALIGQRLKHFELTRLLGRGGMGAVYLGRDTSLERPVAIKVLDPEFGIEPETVARFVREARAQAQLGHGNITQIYFIGEDRGVHFFAMEYVEGRPLDELLESGERVPWGQALGWGIEAARGLRAALAKGFIHRDVKPSNLLVDNDGQVKIADFGLVKRLQGDSELTRQGVIVGSPLYMAPEQGRAEEVDHRSDIYSLGCTLYHLIGGRPPFENPSPVAVMSMHVTDRATRLRALVPDLPETIERLIDRMMSKDPGNRFDTYDGLLAAMDAALPGRRAHTGFITRGLALGVDVGIFGLLALLAGPWAILAFALYSILMHRFLGFTAGKRLLGLRVTDPSGQPIGWRAALVRFLVFAWGPAAWAALGGVVYWLYRDERVSFVLGRLSLENLGKPLLILGLVGAIFLAYLSGFLLAAFHPKKYALHDLAAKTEVTYRRPPLLR